MSKLVQTLSTHKTWIVWFLRVIVGATFIISGTAKLIDLWGFIYKIEQYFQIWGIPPLRSIVFMVSLCISAFEFLAGLFLATGSYKKSCSLALGLFMTLGMLPLSLYIYLTNPVDDCGCFGDFLIISNGATLLKNLFLTLALIYLVKNNAKVPGIYHHYLQWIQLTIGISFTLLIGLIGYNTQPLIDFRGYKTGTSIVNNDNIFDDINFEYIYEKNGKQLTFNENNLPDSSWTFIERITPTQETPAQESEFIILSSDYEDITTEVIHEEGEQLLLLIPEVYRADISYTYLINDLYQFITSRGGDMTGLISANDNGIAYWKDISMSEYNIYQVEDTDIKELARGHISLVYLIDGIIIWKRTLSSIDNIFSSSSKISDLTELSIDGPHQFKQITMWHIAALILLLIIDYFTLRLKHLFYRKNQKKNVTLQNK